MNKTFRVISAWGLLILALVVLAPSGGVLAVEFSEAFIGGKRVSVARVDVRNEHLRLFLNDDAGRPFSRFERLSAWLKLRDRSLPFAMNAGMYHADSSPVGLFVSEGRQISPLNTTNGTGNFFLKPNGVFFLSETGARIVESSEYSRLSDPVILATQSGPLLVHAGKIHPAFNAASESRLIRNGVGVVSQDVVVFAISNDPVNFHEFAALFRDTFRCQNALYLDGVVSSLHSSELKRSDSRADLGPIIGVIE
jgi:uncharacterized protein YigE (DUF2233 family)